MSASLEKGINALKEQVDSTVAAFFSSCTHCGMCADACLFYTETDEAKRMPINKAEPLRRIWKSEYTLLGRVGKMFGMTAKVDDALLTEWETLVYDSCTLCGRCSMVCPVGNDIALLIRKTREGMAAAGHVEKDTGMKIPVDVEGAEYMLLLSSMEIMNFPEFIEAAAKIFDKAGVSWTISSEAFEATNSGIQIGVSDIAAELVQRIVDAAEKLKVKTVISPECGHAYMAIRWEGPNLVGKPFSFKVRHILEVLDEFRQDGRLKITGKEEQRLTYHDPCQISRRGGVIDQPRNLINMFSDNFVEMPDTGKMNWCCGAGGGVSSNERADEIRLRVFQRKKDQLDEIKPDAIVSACSNCRIHLEDGLEEYHMDIPLLSLTETLAEHLAD